MSVLGVLGAVSGAEALGIRLEKLTIQQKTRPQISIRAMYNPTSLSFTVSAEYGKALGIAETAEKTVFKHLKSGELELELILDASRPGMGEPVAEQLALLKDVCMPSPGQQGRLGLWELKISWGRMDWLGEPSCTAVAEKMIVKYTLFDRGGRPLRAHVTLKLKVTPSASTNGEPAIASKSPKQVINNLRDKLGI
ncbi:CIS tube protein [Pseudomonas synxantha]|nr:hypothetical protein [Pseudomonas synxantha]